MKHKSDQEVFKLYQQAKKEINTFFPIGSKRDEEHIAHLNKRVTYEKVSEAEQVKQAKTIEKPNIVENVTSSSQSAKRKGVIHKTFAKKKRKIIEESSNEYEKAEVNTKEKEQEMTLATWSEIDEPGVIKVNPLDDKHPIVSYNFKIRDGSQGYWEFMRSNHGVQGFVRLLQMFDKMDRDDVIVVWGYTKRSIIRSK